MTETRNTKGNTIRFQLKTMVLCRICAELTVFAILLCLPAALFVLGKFDSTPLTGKIIVFALCGISAVFLPIYGYITWRVVVDDEGITAISLLQKQHLSWRGIKRITRRSNWNWLRYIIEHEEGELTFPIWLKNCDQLVELIRNRLPKGAGGGGIPNPFRKFSQDPISLAFQFLQAVLGVGLVAVFWFFYAEITQQKSTSSTDSLMVLVFCVILSALSAWRTFVVALMPRSVELTPGALVINTLFFSKSIAWPDVRKIAPSVPLLPEGFMIKTKKGSYLIGSGTDSLDELVGSVQGRLPPPSAPSSQSPATQSPAAAQTPSAADKSTPAVQSPSTDKSPQADKEPDPLEAKGPSSSFQNESPTSNNGKKRKKPNEGNGKNGTGRHKDAK